MKIKQIYVGSWFQRTTLHLSEIQDFLVGKGSPLKLDKNILKDNLKKLDISDVSVNVDKFDSVRVQTNKDISFSISEDGLFVLKKENIDNIHEDIKTLTSYYENKLSKSIGYIFSLGAPIPKELADIKTVYPYFLVVEDATEEDIKKLLNDFDQEESFEIKKDTFEIYRGDKLYIVNMKGEDIKNLEKFIGEQIFIREFKGQMHRYLNLHRIIWENIAEVKERGEIKGKDISRFKNKIEAYSKTINLIDTRINQMGVYINTRSKVITSSPEMEKFIDVLEFKYETLADTLNYIKGIWVMTKNYVSSALDLFSDLQSKATNSSIKNLTVITSMGVGATLLGLFTKSAPTFTVFGLMYFAVLAVTGYSVNKIMKTIYINKSYSINDTKVDKNIS